MSMKFKTAASAVALSMTLSTGAALSKAHDQGLADGMPLEVNTGQFVQTLEKGISSLQNGGQRGATASGNGSENRVNPVVGNGANAN